MRQTSEMFRVILLISLIFFIPIIHCVRSYPKKVIIDTDPGGDDAVALLLALATEELEVVAITYSYGNSYKGNVEINLLKILTIANRTDIPVYGGAEKPILKDYSPDGFFGKDGMGDFTFNRKITASVDRSKYAPIAMVELSKKYSDDLSIVSLGPLTNIALAIQLDPYFTRRINRFYKMGSLLYVPQNGGNVEYNFGLDPDSDAIFLNSSTKYSSLITTWDVVVEHKISKEWRENVLGKLNSSAIKFLNKAERIALKASNAWEPSDPIAVATMIWPDLITSTDKVRMSVIRYGPSSGAVKVDRFPWKKITKNVEIITDFNVAAFKEKLVKYLG